MINLYINFYHSTDKVRNQEFITCFSKNINNKNLNVIAVESESRLKFSDFFLVIDKVSSNDDINIIANLDIYFDESILLTLDMKKEEVYALSRWNIVRDKVKHFIRKDSQDAWIFRGVPNNVFGDFCMGIPGCDNRLAYEFNKAGYRVANPSYDIKAFHIHSGKRNYGKQKIPSPYMTVDPSHLNNLQYGGIS